MMLAYPDCLRFGTRPVLDILTNKDIQDQMTKTTSINSWDMIALP